MKRISFIFVCLLCFISIANAQINLVPNPSFELYDTCPFSAGPITYTNNWQAASTTFGTPDYFNTCAPSSSDGGVPFNFMGYQYAHSGVAYAGIYVYQIDIQFQTPVREYLEVQLTDSLITGKNYCVSFYVSLFDNYRHAACKLIAITEMGMYFSNNAVSVNNVLPLPYTPQVKSDSGIYLSDTTNWMHVSGIYTALGGEKYITIGNFKGNNTDTTTIVNTIYDPTAYYYIDDVSIMRCNVGIDEIKNENDGGVIYPNPNNGEFTINLNKEYKNVEIEITDVIGQVVYNAALKETTQTTVQLNAKSGIYFIEVKTEAGIMRKKLVKE